MAEPRLVPVDHDPFAAAPVQDSGSGPLVVTVAPNRQPKLVPVDHDPFAQPSTWDNVKNTAADVAQALPTGIIKGAIGIAGLPGLGAQALSAGVDRITDIMGVQVPESVKANKPAVAISPEALTQRFEDATGKLYQPQTTAGKFAQTVGEFVPAAGRGVANQLRYALVPGIASEAAGQATEGSFIEPYARAGAAIAAGVGAGMVGRGNRAPQALAPALQGVDDAALTNARSLMEEAAQRGVPLTWDEAINQVTGNATNLGNVRRVVENSPEGAAILRPMMAERPGQVAAAARQTFDDIGPTASNPASLGREAGTIAENRVNSVRSAINTASEPSYTAASTVRLSPQDMARVKALPGFDEAAKAVRSDPQLARYVQGLPEDSVGFLNEVKKQLDTAAENASSPVNAQRNMQRAAGYGSDAAAVRQAGEAASPDYARALAIQTQGREQILQPILDGPIGKIASKDTTTRQALEALFPSNPLPGSAADVASTMATLVRARPAVAQQLVRLHAEGVFNQAAKSLQGGENVMGGAKFAAAIRGNPQQAENLEAAVRALPQGDARWDGFTKLLEVFEATGKRPAPNSMTAFNQQIQEGMKGGGWLGEAANAVATAGVKLPGRVTKWYEGVQQGKNAAGLAKILVDPNALPLLRALAKEPSTGNKALAVSARLGAMAAQTTRD